MTKIVILFLFKKLTKIISVSSLFYFFFWFYPKTSAIFMPICAGESTT